MDVLTTMTVETVEEDLLAEEKMICWTSVEMVRIEELTGEAVEQREDESMFMMFLSGLKY